MEFTAQIQLFLFTKEKYVDSDLFIKIKIFIVHKKMNHCGHKVCGQQIFRTLLTMFLHLNLFKLAGSFYFLDMFSAIRLWNIEVAPDKLYYKGLVLSSEGSLVRFASYTVICGITN